MNAFRGWIGALVAVVAIAPAVQADPVQFAVGDGRVSLVAVNATAAQIFAAWSRAGGVLIVNAERIQGTLVTLTLENVPEEQALDTLLRPVSGYLARRRALATTTGSMFDRIVILPTPAPPRPVTSPAPTAPSAPTFRPAGVFPQGQPPNTNGIPQPASQPGTAQAPAAPNGIPLGPGVTRLIGPDGQPVEDDQAGAPPTPAPYNGGDPPDSRGPLFAPRAAPPAPPFPTGAAPQQPTPPTSAPAGVPRPGMVVPSPQPQQQQPR
jgi:hypothetical protein